MFEEWEVDCELQSYPLEFRLIYEDTYKKKTHDNLHEFLDTYVSAYFPEYVNMETQKKTPCILYVSGKNTPNVFHVFSVAVDPEGQWYDNLSLILDANDIRHHNRETPPSLMELKRNNHLVIHDDNHSINNTSEFKVPNMYQIEAKKYLLSFWKNLTTTLHEKMMKKIQSTEISEIVWKLNNNNTLFSELYNIIVDTLLYDNSLYGTDDGYTVTFRQFVELYLHVDNETSVKYQKNLVEYLVFSVLHPLLFILRGIGRYAIPYIQSTHSEDLSRFWKTIFTTFFYLQMKPFDKPESVIGIMRGFHDPREITKNEIIDDYNLLFHKMDKSLRTLINLSRGDTAEELDYSNSSIESIKQIQTPYFYHVFDDTYKPTSNDIDKWLLGNNENSIGAVMSLHAYPERKALDMLKYHRKKNLELLDMEKKASGKSSDGRHIITIDKDTSNAKMYSINASTIGCDFCGHVKLHDDHTPKLFFNKETAIDPITNRFMHSTKRYDEFISSNIHYFIEN